MKETLIFLLAPPRRHTRLPLSLSGDELPGGKCDRRYFFFPLEFIFRPAALVSGAPVAGRKGAAEGDIGRSGVELGRRPPCPCSPGVVPPRRPAPLPASRLPEMSPSLAAFAPSCSREAATGRETHRLSPPAPCSPSAAGRPAAAWGKWWRSPS